MSCFMVGYIMLHRITIPGPSGSGTQPAWHWRRRLYDLDHVEASGFGGEKGENPSGSIVLSTNLVACLLEPAFNITCPLDLLVYLTLRKAYRVCLFITPQATNLSFYLLKSPSVMPSPPKMSFRFRVIRLSNRPSPSIPGGPSSAPRQRIYLASRDSGHSLIQHLPLTVTLQFHRVVIS